MPPPRSKNIQSYESLLLAFLATKKVKDIPSDPSSLNDLFCAFWPSIRTTKDEEYSANSISNIRQLLRTVILKKTDLDIFHHPLLKSHNAVFENVLKKLKDIGKGTIKLFAEIPLDIWHEENHRHSRFFQSSVGPSTSLEPSPGMPPLPRTNLEMLESIFPEHLMDFMTNEEDFPILTQYSELEMPVLTPIVDYFPNPVLPSASNTMLPQIPGAMVPHLVKNKRQIVIQNCTNCTINLWSYFFGCDFQMLILLWGSVYSPCMIVTFIVSKYVPCFRCWRTLVLLWA